MAPRIVTKDEIRALQRALASRGLYAGEIDGLYGEKSREAMRRAQEDLGHEIPGMPTVALLIELGVITPPTPKRRASREAMMLSSSCGVSAKNASTPSMFSSSSVA